MGPTAAIAAGKFGRRGQAMVETCLVIVLMCVVFFVLYQVLLAYAYREVLDHAAARAARARTVGFNDWMVRKCYRVAAIPNAGRMLTPEVATVNEELRAALVNMDIDELFRLAYRSSPSSPQLPYEYGRIPYYLGSVDFEQGAAILDYEHWGGNDDSWDGGKIGMYYAPVPNGIGVRVRQNIPWLIPFADAEEGRLSGGEPGWARLVGRFDIEKHYSLYLDVP